MMKKFSMLALAGLIALPAIAAAGGGAASGSDLERKIQDLSDQLNQLKAQMAAQTEATNAKLGTLDNTVASFSDRADEWDLASRIKLYGDYRARRRLPRPDGLLQCHDGRDGPFRLKRSRQ